MPSSSFSRPPIRLKLAIASSLLSSLLAAVMCSFIKTTLVDLSINQISFGRNLLSLILLIPFIKHAKKQQSYREYLKTNQIRTHLIRSISGLITVFLFLESLKSISLSEANVLYSTAPLFIPFALYVWKKQPLSYRGWPAILIAFIGVFILIQPKPQGYQLGLWLALGSGAMGGVAMLAQRFMHYTEPLYRTLFYYTLFSIFINACILPFETISFTALMRTQELLFLVLIGIFVFFAQLFASLSFKYAPVKFIAPFSYLSILFTLFLDLFCWNKVPSFHEIAGMLLIIFGLYLLILFFSQKDRSSLQEEPLFHE